MGRTIEIKLNDTQYAALSAEVDASGQRFYDYCRNKLMAGVQLYGRAPAMDVLPWLRREQQVAQPERGDDDRIARVEDTLAKLVDHILAQPGVVRTFEIGTEDHPQQAGMIDVDSMVEDTLADAERQGLTEPVFTEADREMAIVGVRSVGPRRAPPYSPGTQPPHLR